MSLTNFDFELILTCKRYNFSSDALLLAELREVWAARCEIKLSEVQNIHIAERLVEIADMIYAKYQPRNLKITHIVYELSPARDFIYKYCSGNYWDRVLFIYASALAQTESARFDGLDDYFTNVWKKAGKP